MVSERKFFFGNGKEWYRLCVLHACYYALQLVFGTFQEHANVEVEKMILGNKCDMDDKRVISKERGETIARENGVKFLETSAKTNVNIERAFQELSEAILDKFPGAQDNATSAAGALTKSRHFLQTFYSKKIFLQ